MKPTYEELMARVAQLEEENKPGKLTFKVSPATGVVIVGGVGRFPASLYAETWERILDAEAELRKFIADKRASGHIVGKGSKTARVGALTAEQIAANKAAFAAKQSAQAASA